MRLRKLIFLNLQHLPMPSLGWRSRVCKWGGVNIVNPKKTEIGTNVVFDTMAPENITIEEGVIVSTGCKIISHYLDPETMTPEDRLANRYPLGNVLIKKNAFIGMGLPAAKTPASVPVRSSHKIFQTTKSGLAIPPVVFADANEQFGIYQLSKRLALQRATSRRNPFGGKGMEGHPETRRHVGAKHL